MRVTTRSMVDSVVRHLQANAESLDRIRTQVSSGKRITRPADDPAGTWRALRLRRQEATNEQALRNMDDARNWLTTADRTLNSTNAALSRLRELAVQGADSSYSATERTAMAAEVSQLRAHLLAAFNGATHVDQNVFGGLKTTTSPFSTDANGNAVYAGDTGVTIPTASGDLIAANGIAGITLSDASSAVPGNYRVAVSAPVAPGNTEVDVTLTRYDAAGVAVPGATQTARIAIPASGDLSVTEFSSLGLTLTVNSSLGTVAFGESASSQLTAASAAVAREVAPGTTLPVNVLGSRFLGMFQDLRTLERALTSNDRTKVAASIAAIDEAVDSVLVAQAELGTRLNRIDALEQRIVEEGAEVARVRAATEDVDMTEALTRLTLQQAVYRASLETGARTIPMSILDFLRS